MLYFWMDDNKIIQKKFLVSIGTFVKPLCPMSNYATVLQIVHLYWLCIQEVEFKYGNLELASLTTGHILEN